MKSRDQEIRAVASQINELLDDLNDTVAALTAILTGSSQQKTGTEDPRHEQPRP